MTQSGRTKRVRHGQTCEISENFVNADELNPVERNPAERNPAPPLRKFLEHLKLWMERVWWSEKGGRAWPAELMCEQTIPLFPPENLNEEV